MRAMAQLTLTLLICAFPGLEAAAHVVTMRRELSADTDAPIEGLEMKKETMGDEEAVDEEHFQNLQEMFTSGVHCNTDFVLGNPLTDDCADDDTDSKIQGVDLCQQAAQLANVQYHGDVDSQTDTRQRSPKNCFLARCDGNNSKPCFFYNSIGDDQGWSASNINQGRPVCRRNRYVYGTPNKNPDVGCPHGYKSVDMRYNCELAQTCLGENWATNFNPGDVNVHEWDLHPHLCYVAGGRHADPPANAPGTVFFNDFPEIREGHGVPCCPAGHSCPADCQAGSCTSCPLTTALSTRGGTPICVVERILYFPNAGNNEIGSGGRRRRGDYPAMYGQASGWNVSTSSEADPREAIDVDATQATDRGSITMSDECLRLEAANGHGEPVYYGTDHTQVFYDAGHSALTCCAMTPPQC